MIQTEHNDEDELIRISIDSQIFGDDEYDFVHSDDGQATIHVTEARLAGALLECMLAELQAAFGSVSGYRTTRPRDLVWPYVAGSIPQNDLRYRISVCL